MANKAHFPTSSKQRILQQSKQQKLSKAREFKQANKLQLAIEMYHKVLFLSQKPQYLIELAEIYQYQLYDISTAIIFYRRALHLKPKSSTSIKQKLKQLTKIKGLQLLEIGACKNILQGSYLEQEKDIDSEVMAEFKRIYPMFHQRLIKTYIINLSQNICNNTNSTIYHNQLRDPLSCCLAYLQTNSRQFALAQIQKCLSLQQNNVDMLVLKALINWSMLENEQGYKLFWQGYRVDRQHSEISVFLRIISPKVEELYREAKYDLIEKQSERCKLKVDRALMLHPYHNNLLILKAFLHRTKEEYKQALQCLQIANQNLQSSSQQQQDNNNNNNRQSQTLNSNRVNYKNTTKNSQSVQLKSQIALTYNQMAIYLFKQQSYQQAIDLFTEGLKFKPTDYGLLTNRGDCHKAMNNFLKALEDYLSAYEIQSKSSQLNLRISTIYNLRAVSLFNSKNYQLALKEFNQALKFTPYNSLFLTGKAKCLVQLSRKQQAIQLLTESLQQNPNNNQIKSFLSQVKDPQQKRGANNRKIIQLSKQKS